MEGEAGQGKWFSSLSTTAKAVFISSGIVTAAGVGFLLYRNFFSDNWCARCSSQPRFNLP